MDQPPIVVTSGKTPFEVTILSATAAAGIALTLAGTRPRSVSEAMPTTVQVTWQAALVLTGVAGLVGVYWRGEVATGLGVELGALVGLGTATCMYTIALIAISGVQAIAAASFVSAIGVASWLRAAEIVRDLRRLARAGDADTTGGSEGG